VGGIGYDFDHLREVSDIPPLVQVLIQFLFFLTPSSGILNRSSMAAASQNLNPLSYMLMIVRDPILDVRWKSRPGSSRSAFRRLIDCRIAGCMCAIGVASRIGFEAMPSIVVENLTIDSCSIASRAIASYRAVAKARAIGEKDHRQRNADQHRAKRLTRSASRSKRRPPRSNRTERGGEKYADRVLADIYARRGKDRTSRHAHSNVRYRHGFDNEATGYENIFLPEFDEMGLTRREIADRTDEIAAFSELENTSIYRFGPIRRHDPSFDVSIATSVAGDIILMDEWISVGDEFSFRSKAQSACWRLRARPEF